MTKKWTKVSRRMLFAWCMLSGFIFLFAPQRMTGRFQLAFARVFSWPLSTGRIIAVASRTAASTDTVSQDDYDRLRKANLQLRNLLHNVIEQRDQEHHNVERLVGLKTKPAWQRLSFVLTGLITFCDETRTELIINRGRNDGLATGQYVLAQPQNCIIGLVSDISATRAKVKLITNPTCKLPVRLARRDGDRFTHIADGLMQGKGDNQAKIGLQPAKLKVRPGDVVLAATKPGRLDVPIVAGTVLRRTRDIKQPLLWDITVEPVCDINKLAELAVIIEGP